MRKTSLQHLGLAVATSVALIIGLECIRRYFFLRDDSLTQFLPQVLLGEQTLLWEKTVPLINYYQLLGNPSHGQGQYGFLYPLRILSYLLAWAAGNDAMLVDIEASFHILLSVFFMYLFLRTYDVDPRLCALASVVYSFNGFFMVAGQSWLHISGNLLFIPLQFYLVRRLLESDRPASVGLLLGLTRGLICYNGHVQSIVYNTVFEVIFFILSAFTSRRTVNRGKVAWYIFSFVVTGVLATGVFLPVLETLQHSVRAATSDYTAQYYGFPALPTEFVKGSVLPYPLVDSAEQFGAIGPRFITVYFNPLVFATLFTLLGLAIARSWRRRPALAAGAVIVSAVILLYPAPVAHVLLPGAGDSLLARRWEVLLGLWVTAAFIGYTAREVAQPSKAEKGTAERGVSVLVCVLLFGLTCAFGTFSPLYHLLYNVPYWNHFRWPFKFLLPVHFLATAVAALLLQRAGRIPCGLLLAGVWLVATLSIFYMGAVSATDFSGDEIPAVATPVLPPLQTEQFGGYRVIPVLTGRQRLIEGQARSFSSVYRTYNWLGYDLLIDESKQFVIGFNELSTLDDDVFFEARREAFRAYGVRWYLCPRGERDAPRFLESAEFRRHPWGERFWAYEDTAAEPIVHLAGSNVPVPFQRSGNMLRVELAAPMADRGLLVVAFWGASGTWDIRLDGSPGTMNPDALGRMLIPLPQGCRTVEIEYRSPAFTTACIVMAVGLPALLLLYLFLERSRQ